MDSTLTRRDLLRTGAALGAGAAAGTLLGGHEAVEAARRAARRVRAPEVTLTYMVWQLYDHEAEIERKLLVAPFERMHPNIKIKNSVIPGFQAYSQKLLTSFAAGQPPDVFGMSVAYVWDYAHLKKVFDLQPHVNKDIKKSDYFLNIAKGTTTYQGDIYAFPFEWVCSVLYYNKDIFDRARIKYPDETWTYDHVLMAAKELTGKGQYGFVSNSAHTMLDSLIVGNGGSVINGDYTRCTLDEPVAIDTIQWLVDLIHKYKVAPTADESKSIGLSASAPFQSGKIGMLVDGSWNIETTKSAGFRWGITMVPKAKLRRVIYGGPDSLSIPTSSQHPAEAWEWLKFLVGARRPLRSFGAGTVPFYRPNAYSRQWLSTGKPAVTPEQMRVILQSVPYIQGAEFGHNWSKWRLDAMNSDLTPAFLGRQSVREAVKRTVADVNAILKEAF
jgi:multiple sugar transport system substrate-binding protein